MLESVLIANRGEIALRVIRTCRSLGVRSVAIYSDLDRNAPHVRDADDAVHVSSYLAIEAVVAAAKASGVEAVHPGYGFLSERAEFARAVEEAGLVLVGPSADVMERMGRKDAAREIAVAAGVPVIQSYDVTDARVAISQELPYPVLVKAAAGGGGKGMRIVRSQEEYAAAMVSAAREAATAFGDDTLLVEKYVEHGRHIEVQVLADHHGNVVHLFERDCSTQRRHQKVLEEAPAPTISDDARRLVLASAVDLAAHVGYRNAGTVEFLLDAETDEAYFLEMNTRLQVEHPVTESVVRWQTLEQRATGRPGEHVDLVALQLLVASGEPLPFTQSDLSVHGHAIEARVYAEDPYAGFLPQAGTASIVRWPTGVRVDAALESGQVVSTAYDPMLGKVIASGPDRESARRALVAALDDTAVLGLTTNTGFLRELAASDAFRDAEIDTAWLDRTELPRPDADLARIFGAWTQAFLDTLGDPGPWQTDGWRLGADPAPVVVDLDGPVVVDTFHGRVDDHEVSMVSAENHVMQLIVDGTPCRAVVNVQSHFVEVSLHGQRWTWERPDVFADHGPDAGSGTIVAPMPGTVLEVRVEKGQTVAEGEVLGMMEAMKMELSLTAPFAGTVSAVEAAVGDQVVLGATLFVVDDPETGDPETDDPETDDPETGEDDRADA